MIVLLLGSPHSSLGKMGEVQQMHHPEAEKVVWFAAQFRPAWCSLGQNSQRSEELQAKKRSCAWLQ